MLAIKLPERQRSVAALGRLAMSEITTWPPVHADHHDELVALVVGHIESMNVFVFNYHQLAIRGPIPRPPQRPLLAHPLEAAAAPVAKTRPPLPKAESRLVSVGGLEIKEEEVSDEVPDEPDGEVLEEPVLAEPVRQPRMTEREMGKLKSPGMAPTIRPTPLGLAAAVATRQQGAAAAATAGATPEAAPKQMAAAVTPEAAPKQMAAAPAPAPKRGRSEQANSDPTKGDRSRSRPRTPTPLRGGSCTSSKSSSSAVHAFPPSQPTSVPSQPTSVPPLHLLPLRAVLPVPPRHPCSGLSHREWALKFKQGDVT
jgi:hypothetical protein